VIATITGVVTPSSIAITPDNSRAYVTNTTNNTVTVINTATNKVIDLIPVGSGPGSIAITPDGSRAYVANLGGSLSVIDIATNTVIATVTDGVPCPIRITITPAPAPQVPTSIEDCKRKAALGDLGRPQGLSAIRASALALFRGSVL